MVRGSPAAAAMSAMLPEIVLGRLLVFLDRTMELKSVQNEENVYVNYQKSFFQFM